MQVLNLFHKRLQMLWLDNSTAKGHFSTNTMRSDDNKRQRKPIHPDNKALPIQTYSDSSIRE